MSMSRDELVSFIEEIVKIPYENEWVEFKLNSQTPERIGEYISALANSACLHQATEAYLIFGVDDKTHDIVGTQFTYRGTKGKGEEDLEPWLRRNLKPSVDFEIKEINHPGGLVTVFFIPPASSGPVKFLDKAWIRIGSSKKPLGDFEEKEAIIWDRRKPFEAKIARKSVTENEVFELLDYDKYYQLTQKTRPKNQSAIIDSFLQEKFLLKNRGGMHISNLGAILLARDMSQFEKIKNKAVRVITYSGINRLHTVKDITGKMGYATGFESLMSYIGSQLPEVESIGDSLRTTERSYPKKALREFVANALVHQDFSIQGSSPLVEIFNDRIEISNPGKPLVETDRFIDNQPLSRNEKIADSLRLMRVCEKRGSGVDRAMHEIELAQLPAPNIESNKTATKVTIYSNKDLSKLTKLEQYRACYYHASLKFVLEGVAITNATLCQRLNIDEKNKAIASRIIKETKVKGWIKDFDPDNRSPRYASYLPYWA